MCNLLDSKVEVVSDEIVLLSFEYESSVNENLSTLDKLTDIYNKITGSKKKLIFVSLADWKKIKEQYIINFKNNYEYNIVEEPDPIYEETKNDDIINDSAIDLFGDIVEFE